MNTANAIRPQNIIMSVGITFLLALSLMFMSSKVSAEVLSQGGWVGKQYSIQGGWEVKQKNGQTVIRFSDDFKTKSGPDLKVFLSRKDIANVNGRNATQDAIKLDVLASNKGAQEYVLPQGVSLSDFSSILIHCEAYSVLWGGSAI